MLKIAVIGTGGVGGIFGALFAKAGHDVHFLARGQHLAQIRASGLQVETPTQNFRIFPAQATSRAEEIGFADLVLVCVKTWQLPEACQQIAPLIGPKTLVLPLENGVESSEYLTEKFPNADVLRGFCAVISFIEVPGKIKQVGIPPFLCFGEYNNRISDRIRHLHQSLDVPEIRIETPEDIVSMQWQKFLFISSLAAITSVTRLAAGALRSLPETRSLIEEAMLEVEQLARQKQIALASNAVQKALQLVDQMPESGTTSMQRDFQAKRRTELESFSGYIWRESQRLGLPSPIHRICYHLLLPFELEAQGKLQLTPTS